MEGTENGKIVPRDQIAADDQSNPTGLVSEETRRILQYPKWNPKNGKAISGLSSPELCDVGEAVTWSMVCCCLGTLGHGGSLQLFNNSFIIGETMLS